MNMMMDPEMIRLAQEQMSRMSPADFARIQQQMMANPELMKMASESMKNMRPEDLKQAAEQLKHTRPEDMANIGEKMANATPEEIAAMRTHVDDQVTYELNAAQVLKKQGNELHNQGRFNDALQKYLLAKKNLKNVPSSKGSSLMMACSLNLMSCYLKTRQYDECVEEGSEVLAYDEKNVKALYRRGQAYKELGRFEDAVSDLSIALEVSPDDETIADVLRDAKEGLAKEGGKHSQRRLMIEELNEEGETPSSAHHKSLSAQVQKANGTSKIQNGANVGGPSIESECLQALKDDPETIRSFQNFISKTDPNTLATLFPGSSREMSADMVKAAANMMGNMSAEELQRVVNMASSFHSDNPSANGGSIGINPGSFRNGAVPPNMTPEMLKTATDMMGKMSPEDMQKMFEMTASLKEKESFPLPTSLNTKGTKSDNGSKTTEHWEKSPAIGTNNEGESSSRGIVPDSRTTPAQSSFTPSTSDMQEQMRNQMKDPAMRQMFTSMMKNMSPDMMANMSEQFGLNLSREDAEKAQQAMSSLSPEDLDRMMRWADKIQRGAEGVKKTKNWLLGRPGMILAICMLILAVILHRLGYIGV